jgi:hypothetical protein
MPNVGGLIDIQVAQYQSGFSNEPTLADLFGDPMTHVLMAADRVNHSELQALLQRARRFVKLDAESL